MPFETGAGAPRRIAVIGGGISGMGAANMLADSQQVTLFEAEPRLGGHARTIVAGRHGDQDPVSCCHGFLHRCHIRGTDIDQYFMLAVGQQLVFQHRAHGVNRQIRLVANLLAQHAQVTERTLGIEVVANYMPTMRLQPDCQIKCDCTLPGTALEISDNSDHGLTIVPRPLNETI